MDKDRPRVRAPEKPMSGRFVLRFSIIAIALFAAFMLAWGVGWYLFGL